MSSQTLPDRIVFVCAGNICRSPLAEYVFRQQQQHGLDSPPALTSAGLIAIPGDAANSLTLKVAAKLGIDLSQHRARRLNFDELRASDLVLVMEERQRLEILAATTRHDRPDIQLLGGFEKGRSEIFDPGGGLHRIEKRHLMYQTIKYHCRPDKLF